MKPNTICRDLLEIYFIVIRTTNKQLFLQREETNNQRNKQTSKKKHKLTEEQEKQIKGRKQTNKMKKDKETRIRQSERE
jgi:lipopolysaccharide export LptBFGC system permease protein LptF